MGLCVYLSRCVFRFLRRIERSVTEGTESYWCGVRFVGGRYHFRSGAGDDAVLLAETDLGLVGRNSAADGGFLGAPFSEKTTLIRALALELSKNNDIFIIDERSEISGRADIFVAKRAE